MSRRNADPLQGALWTARDESRPWEVSCDGGRTWTGATWSQVTETARRLHAPSDRLDHLRAGGTACLDLDRRQVFARRRRTQAELTLDTRQLTLGLG